MKERISNALKALNIEKLNEMQEMSLRANESGRNVLLLSPTGSGKTLAFLLPLLRQLKVDANESQALILAPSRELALQIEQVFKGMKEFYKDYEQAHNKTEKDFLVSEVIEEAVNMYHQKMEEIEDEEYSEAGVS